MSRDFPDLVKGLPIFDGPFDAYKLESKEFNVLFASYPAGTEVSAHNHDTENVGVVTCGKLQLTTNGSTVEYGPGEWYHLDSHQEHAAAFPEDTRILEIWLKRDSFQ